jgi:hypothetical protein
MNVDRGKLNTREPERLMILPLPTGQGLFVKR